MESLGIVRIATSKGVATMSYEAACDILAVSRKVKTQGRALEAKHGKKSKKVKKFAKVAAKRYAATDKKVRKIARAQARA